MIHRTTLALPLIALLLSPCAWSAGVEDFLKKAVTGESAPKGKKSRTEELIQGGLKTVRSLMPIGYKEEMAIGGSVALEAVARFGGLWQNAEVDRYIATVGAAVARTSDRPEIPYYFGVLNTDQPNAFACPGGYIFLSKGLLQMVRTEAELAGILGHEIAHVSAKHALNAIRRSKALSSVSEVTLAALEQDPKMFDSIVKETTQMLFDRGLSQNDEREADRLGTEFAFRVGYRPAALEEFLAVLGGYSGTRGSGVFKTHPSPKDRIAGLKRELAMPGYRGAGNLPALAERWQAVRTAANL